MEELTEDEQMARALQMSMQADIDSVRVVIFILIYL